MTADKVRENRLRRAAERQGLRLVKSRRRDEFATGYGTFRLEPADTPANHDVDDAFGSDLDQIEQQLRGETPPPR